MKNKNEGQPRSAGHRSRFVFADLGTKFRKFLDRAFNKDNRVTTISILTAVLVAIFLLFVPAIFGQRNGKKDPLAINPETGYTNRETEWNRFVDMIHSRVYELSAPDRTAPQRAVLDYFDALLESYVGVAQRMDILATEGEYYLNLGLPTEALNVLVAADTNYPQPADNDPDLNSYFARVINYYTLLAKTYKQTGDEAMSNSITAKLSEIKSTHDRLNGIKEPSE